MSSDYWTRFWASRGREAEGMDPQVQVLRTLNRQPVSDQVLSDIVDSIVGLLRPPANGALLDLCCGNGVITQRLADRFRKVVAVDVAGGLVSQVERGGSGHVTALCEDARAVEFEAESFDRVLIYAGIQYFSAPEVVELFMRIGRWLRTDGMLVLGDVPDATRIWNFFNTPERESAYFEGLRRGEPVVGTWFAPEWLEKASRHAGFSTADIRQQPATHPYRHYRFDAVFGR